MQKTKILCTMGPSCESLPVLKEMIRSGMNIARLNMAHGELEEHSERIRKVRAASKEMNVSVPVLLDIKGPEIRIGKFKESAIELSINDEIILTTEQVLGDSKRIPVNYEDMPNVLKPGSCILIDDGLIELTVNYISGSEINCKVLNGGTLKPRKGVNLPGVKTTLPGITERDVRHIMFGLENGIDIIAVSFVRKVEDILEVRRILKERNAEHIQIISKIENEEGVANLDGIIEVSDGIMVARGDLGVEIQVEEVPLVQREIIVKCNTVGKPVIVATHMLESMQINPRPTRAEVSDVSTAVLQGADVLMLSGETAAGKYPVESVRTMATVAEKAETSIDYSEQFALRKIMKSANVTEIISQAAASSSLELNAKAIITPTESGFTARMVSKYRPKAPIIAITRHPHVMMKLCLMWGVIPVMGSEVRSTDEMFASAIENSCKTGLLKDGDFVVISAGVPIGKSGSTNLIKIQQISSRQA
ncbi:pyruvate kinase [Fontibacillus panacisegetis]|uniref:Pyruvate kinase n=1 Tax=Fontibacillus panacisegetis TaxID=670482 RepID=A0A1G7TEG9_9BACL|nr:pyruvate kinase [Fontibacillus panacisegetis]SDG33059.1 pyruvate kinase [Fontibacillus panacisegetis]